VSPFHWTPALAAVVVLAATVVVYRFAVSPAAAALSRWAMPTSTAPSPGPTGTASAAVDSDPAGRGSTAYALGWAVLLAADSGVAIHYGRGPEPGGLQWFAAFLVAMLSWSFGTTDFDLRRPEAAQWVERGALVLTGVAGVLWPPALLAWLAVMCGRLRGWTHHAMMPLRLLKAYLAWYLAVAVLPLGADAVLVDGERAGLFFVLAVVCLSHYLKPAWSKIRLGPRWWSWAWENRTDFILANAYNCGWAGFVPERVVTRVLRAMPPWVRLLNVGTLVVEASPLVAFLDRRLFLAVLAATVVFHSVIFLCAGILFWEGIATNAGLAATVLFLPAADTALAFGLLPAAVAVLVMALAIRDLVWQPYHLGWWDNPFTTRIRWRVETASGRVFDLSNDWMCPFDREFGRWTGLFFVPEPVLGGANWGSTLWDRELRDRVRAAVGDLASLDELKRDHGTLWWNEQHCADHEAFLQLMFGRLNSGARKGPVPRRLRWLKAPGGQLFHWGRLPRYRGDEPVRRITISCEERCYIPATAQLALLRERTMRMIEVPGPPP
jgi:hypothetical protein